MLIPIENISGVDRKIPPLHQQFFFNFLNTKMYNTMSFEINLF